MKNLLQKDFINKLYIVPTPIGNLDDITIKALKTLNNVDLILCEDTRIGLQLLNKFGIKKTLKVFNDHSKEQDIENVLSLLASGMNIALISDAGTPGISDPGYKLINRVLTKNLAVEVLPGATAFVPALIMSNFPNDNFYFGGFLARKKSLLQKQMDILLSFETTGIFYDSPNRILKNINYLNEIADFEYCIVRELTKIYEEAIWFDKNDMQLVENLTIKGEIVLLIRHKKNNDIKEPDIKQEIANLLDANMSSNEIKKIIKATYNLKNNQIYDLILEVKNGK